jgi:TPR repeat protein
LVEAVRRVGRTTLSAIGHSLTGSTTAKSRIQRAWRFCDSDRAHVAHAMAGVVNRLARRREKPLRAAIDWTEVRALHTLKAAAVLGGRAIPLLWTDYTGSQSYRGQNGDEEAQRLLGSMLPAGR